MTEFTNDWILKYSKKGFFIKSKSLGLKFRENERDFFINVIMNGDISIKYDGYSVNNGTWFKDKKIMKVEGEFAYSKKDGFITKGQLTEVSREKLKDNTYKYTPSKFVFSRLYKSISNRYYVNLGNNKVKFNRYSLDKNVLEESDFYTPGDFTFVEINSKKYEKDGSIECIGIERRNARDVLIEEIQLTELQLDKVILYYCETKNATGLISIENYNSYSLLEVEEISGRRLSQSIFEYNGDFYLSFGRKNTYLYEKKGKVIDLFTEIDDDFRKVALKIDDMDTFMMDPYHFNINKENVYSLPSKGLNCYSVIPNL